MAYCNGSVRTGKPEVTKIFCDACADNGKVPFELDEDGVKMQCKPWRWHPIYGDNCHNCGKRC